MTNLIITRGFLGTGVSPLIINGLTMPFGGGGDTTAPTLTIGSIPTTGYFIPFTASEPTNQGTQGFTVTINSVPIAGTVSWTDSTHGKFTPNIAQFGGGQSVTIAYNSGTGTVMDTAGNPLESFAATAVTNNSTSPYGIVVVQQGVAVTVPTQNINSGGGPVAWFLTSDVSSLETPFAYTNKTPLPTGFSSPPSGMVIDFTPEPSMLFPHSGPTATVTIPAGAGIGVANLELYSGGGIGNVPAGAVLLIVPGSGGGGPTTPPAVAPVPTTLDVCEDGQITLNWEAVANSDWYQVFVNGSVWQVTTGTAFVITPVTIGQTYQVQVLAGNAYGVSAMSGILQVTPCVSGEEPTQPSRTFDFECGAIGA